MTIDPIHEKNGKWYFYDESWSEVWGPFETHEEAEHELAKYLEKLG